MLYRLFKKIAFWGSQHPKLSIFIIILLQGIMWISSFFFGVLLFTQDIEIPFWIIFALITGAVAIRLLLPPSRQRFLTRFSIASLVVFSFQVLAVIYGNYILREDFNPIGYNFDDIILESSSYGNPQISSVEYNAPPAEKIKKKKKKKRFTKRNNTKRYWKRRIKQLTKNTAPIKVLRGLAILYFILGGVTIALSCAPACYLALGVGLGAVGSSIVLIGMLASALVLFVLGGKLIVDYKQKKSKNDRIPKDLSPEKERQLQKKHSWLSALFLFFAAIGLATIILGIVFSAMLWLMLIGLLVLVFSTSMVVYNMVQAKHYDKQMEKEEAKAKAREEKMRAAHKRQARFQNDIEKIEQDNINIDKIHPNKKERYKYLKTQILVKNRKKEAYAHRKDLRANDARKIIDNKIDKYNSEIAALEHGMNVPENLDKKTYDFLIENKNKIGHLSEEELNKYITLQTEAQKLKIRLKWASNQESFTPEEYKNLEKLRAEIKTKLAEMKQMEK